MGVCHVQEKRHKHNHVFHRKDVPWQQVVETDSTVPQVTKSISFFLYFINSFLIMSLAMWNETSLLTPMQVSVSASLWCVTETRTVRMAWMREAVIRTAASTHVTWTKPLLTLTSQAEGE